MASKGIWALDVGSNALKAMHMVWGGDRVEVIGFDFVEHRRMLSGVGLSDEEKKSIVAESLHKFVENNDVGSSQVAMAVPSRNSFARFVKLPPVEKKGIPKVVQYEAVQQIPFDINEVEWDWQLMEIPDSPDTEVGLFAIKNELISDELDLYSREKLNVSCVQIGSMALYNYLFYDADDLMDVGGKAMIILDMGAENTNMVVCTKSTVWQRSIRIGGNAFTETIADAFKLNFEKAEKLKRQAAVSKYAKQIFTAMKPTFTDFSSEIQRSLGFYSTSGPGRDRGFAKVVALGGGMKLQGLAKYLAKSLDLPVVKPDSFNKMQLAEGVSSAKFHEHVSDFATVYGLGVQMFDQGKISSNLLPRKMATAMMWKRKSLSLNIAAAVVVLVGTGSLIKAVMDKGAYGAAGRYRSQIASVVSEANAARSQLQEQESRGPQIEQKVQEIMDLFRYRDIIPKLNTTMIKCLPNAENTPDQKTLFEAMKAGEMGTVLSFPRSSRKQLFITSVRAEFSPTLATAVFGETTRTTTRPSGGGGMMPGGMMPGMDGGFMMPGMMPGGGMPGMPGGGMPGGGYSPPSGGTGSEEGGEEAGAGFVVIIEGYSPYAKIGDLLDPAGVANNPALWGFVTRLENLPQVVQDTPFGLFNKNNITDFQLETGEVDISDPQMPQGIGVVKEVQRIELPQNQTGQGGVAPTVGMGGLQQSAPDKVYVEKVLVDPMTGEEISKTFDIYTQEDISRNPNLTERDLGRVKYTQFNEPQYIVRDHWFRVKAKFVWKDAPQIEGEGGGGGYGGGFGGMY